MGGNHQQTNRSQPARQQPYTYRRNSEINSIDYFLVKSPTTTLAWWWWWDSPQPLQQLEGERLLTPLSASAVERAPAGQQKARSIPSRVKTHGLSDAGKNHT